MESVVKMTGANALNRKAGSSQSRDKKSSSESQCVLARHHRQKQQSARGAVDTRVLFSLSTETNV